MSQGSKRRSAKQIGRDFKHVFQYEDNNVEVENCCKPWLTMTNEEIDQNYWNIGKSDKCRMKKEAEQEKLRLQVRKILEAEKATV